jgi:hypothetical protein
MRTPDHPHGRLTGYSEMSRNTAFAFKWPTSRLIAHLRARSRAWSVNARSLSGANGRVRPILSQARLVHQTQGDEREAISKNTL